MNNRSLFPGFTLIALGIIFLLPNFTNLRWEELWPFFVIAPGLWFFALFARDRTQYGLLLPASVVTVTGVLLLYCSLTGWHAMGELWPLFLVAPGAGFLLMYQFGSREPGLLVPGLVLIVLGGFFLIGASIADYFWPLVLIIVGVVLLLRRKKPPQSTVGTASEPPHTV